MYRFAIIAAIVIAALTYAYSGGSAPAPIAYRLTAHTDYGKFSTVRIIHFEAKRTNLAMDLFYDGTTHGEALVVTRPDGRKYYGLIGDKLLPWYALSDTLDAQVRGLGLASKPAERTRIQADLVRRWDRVEELPKLWEKTRGGKRTVAPWPRFVTFQSIDRPLTVTEADPDTIGIRRMTIEIVHGPVAYTLGDTFTEAYFADWREKSQAQAAKQRAWRKELGQPYKPGKQELHERLSQRDFYSPKRVFLGT